MFYAMLVGCTNAIEITEVETITIPTPKPSPSPTLTPTPNFWPPSGIIPEIILRCPNPRYIPIEDIGFGEDTGIVVSIGDPDDFRTGIISGSDPILKILPEISDMDGIEQLFLGVSPDGKWAAYRVGDPSVGGSYISIWITSLDGSQQWEIKNILMPINDWALIMTNWLSNDELRVSISINETEEIYTRYVALINIYTLDETPYMLEKKPDWVEYMVYPSFYDSSAPYLIYYGLSPSDYDAGLSTMELYLYDRENNTSEVAFPWLENPGNNPYFFVFNASLTVNEYGQATVVVFRQYGFDIALDLELDNISSSDDYEQIVNKVLLEEITTNGLHQWVKNDAIAFFLNSEWPSTLQETPFYVYEWKNNILIDYCLTAAELPIFGQSLDSSGKFVARWDGATSVLVLNLETGEIARIPDAGFSGWVEFETD